MGKALKTIGTIAAVVALVATGVGAAAGAGIAAAGIASAAAGVASVATLVSIAATVGGSLLTTAARRALTAFDPKSINPDPASPRKLVFGQTTFVVDLRYAEPSGTNQEYIDYIFALAAHKSDAISEIYIEDDLAWTVGGGAQGKYVGYLTVEVILEAGSGAYHTVNAGTTWNSSTRLTGCTTMKVRVKRSDNSKSSQSPFSSGINGRWAVIGRGIPVYDPALDSTVAGGSGAQRAATQTTWAYTAGAARGNNPALQLLTYLLGWRIGGVVSVGCGLPVDTIDLPSFATAAALCDESVALAAGGSQRRYEAGRAFADSDDPLAVIRTLLDAMNGELVDDGGRLSLRLAVNDLTPSYTLTDDDFVSGYSWKPAAPIEQQYTVVRGRYSAPGATLYSLVDYPEVAIARTSLAPRPLTLELSAVQEPRRAERIAKQAAVRNLYQGTFAVTLGVRGWLLRRNMVVAVTSSARGWTAKLFRVRSLGFNDDATVEVVLREENAAIYAWSASESAQVTPVAPVVFDSRKAASWLMADIAPGADVTSANTAANSNALGGTPAATVAGNITTAGTTAQWPNVTGTGRPADNATVGAVAGTNLLDSGGRTLTDGEISNTAQRVAVRQWAFNNQSLNGWSGVAHGGGTAPTVTAGSQFATFTANSSDCSLFSPDMLDVDGRVGRYLRLILSATATLSAGMRNVEVYFSTNAYAPIDGTRSKNGDWIPANHPTNGTPFEVLLDMHSLTFGGNAWRDEIVRRVRIDFDGTVPETIRIHEISMVYLGTATVGAPSGTPVGAYADSASIAPAVASAATTAQWPNVTGTGRPADYADVTANNTAFDTARVNGVLAATLTTQSATAASQAATATSTLAAIASDSVLSRGEKAAVILEWEAISDEYADIDAKAAALSVTSERTAWQTARSALDAYLSSLTPPWYDTSADTAIVAATFRGKFRDYYAARNVLLNKLVQVASTLAQWPSVTGTGRPADNATNTAAPNANRVQNSLFETGTNNAEWGTYGDGASTANPATLSTFGGFSSTVISGSVPNNTARVILSSNRTIPVTAGETIFVGVGANTGATTVVIAQVMFLNASNAYITEINVGAVAANTNGRSTGFITVPAGATQGVFRVQLSSTGSGAVSATIYQPMVSGAVAGQTLLPAFTRGLNALDGADVTAQNTAANSIALGGIAAATVAGNITAAGTTAQWPNVTGTGRPADYATNTAPPNANRAPFSRMEGNQGYRVIYNPTPLAHVSEYGTFQSLRFFKTSATATAPGQVISIGYGAYATPSFKLTPGERVSVQARVEVAGVAAGSYTLALFGFQTDGVTESAIATVSGGVTYIGAGVVSFFVDVPVWAVQGRLELYGYSSGAGSYQVAISEPMVSGAIAGQTLHPAFTPGPNSFDGADVTALNTAAAIAGQAWAATNGAQALVDNRLVPVGSNAVVNSDFTRGKFGFGWAGGGFESQWGVNLPGWFGQRNVMWATSSGVLASGAEKDLSPKTIWQGFSSADAPLFALPVVPNERLFASVLAARHRCTFQLFILMFDASFNLINAPVSSGGRSGGAANGDPANFDLLTVTGDVPANARWAIPMYRMLGTGESDPYIFFTQPMFGKMAAIQTVVPSYISGRADLLADATRSTLPALQRGAWSASSVAYALGDIVTRDGSSYTCIIANTSTGANGPPGANWALLANVGAQGPTGVSAPPIKSLSTGAAQLDPIRLLSGQTVTAAAELYLNTGGVAGVCSLELQISVAGAGSWATMTSGTVTDSQPTSEPVELVITGATFTNSGADRLFDIRAVSTRQSRSVNVPPSFVRVV